jgi:NTE family protein
MTDSGPHKLTAGEVRLLALEGGGGKGAAYLGALAVLADPAVGLLKATSDGRTETATLDKSRVNRIAGSSAGAITATLVACGYSLDEILEIVTSPALLKFYDAPKMVRPVVGRGRSPSVVVEPTVAPTGRGPFATAEHEETLERLEAAKGPANAAGLVGRVIKNLLDRYGVQFLSLPTAVQRLLETESIFSQYALSLLTDYGLMSGEGARRLIDGLIARKTVRSGSTTYGITFDDFLHHHGVELHLTGTRLETGTFHYFSARSTPQFRVADAVRISMSIPILFKPVVIREGDFPDDELVGTWVDGGVLNNLPMHAFDNELGVIDPHVLGLRLGVDIARTIGGFGDFAGALLETLLAPGELGQIRTPQEQIQTVILPTGGLSTAEFLAKPNVLRDAVKQSASATMRYFDLEKTTSSFLINRFGFQSPEPEPLLTGQ